MFSLFSLQQSNTVSESLRSVDGSKRGMKPATSKQHGFTPFCILLHELNTHGGGIDKNHLCCCCSSHSFHRQTNTHAHTHVSLVSNSTKAGRVARQTQTHIFRQSRTQSKQGERERGSNVATLQLSERLAKTTPLDSVCSASISMSCCRN
jgi:hypothetical protein